jgi:hypothetical protein
MASEQAGHNMKRNTAIRMTSCASGANWPAAGGIAGGESIAAAASGRLFRICGLRGDHGIGGASR